MVNYLQKLTMKFYKAPKNSCFTKISPLSDSTKLNWYTLLTLRSREVFENEPHFLITCIKWLALDILCLILDISFVELDILSSSGFAKPPFSWNEVEEAAEAGFRGMVCCWMVFSRSPTFSRVSSRPVDNEKNYTNWIRTCTVMSMYVLCTFLQRRKKWNTNWMYLHKWRTFF